MSLSLTRNIVHILFSFSRQSSFRLMFPRTAPALVIITRPHHRSQSQVMGAGARCWLSCLPGKFRSITLKLNSNTESACLSSGPGASQHSINLTFNCEAQGKGRAKGRPRNVTQRSFIDGGWWMVVYLSLMLYTKFGCHPPPPPVLP